MSSSDDDLPLQLLREKYTSETLKPRRILSTRTIKEDPVGEIEDFGAQVDSIMNLNGSWNASLSEPSSPILTNRISSPPPLPTHYLDEEDEEIDRTLGRVSTNANRNSRIFVSTDGKTVYESPPFMNGMGTNARTNGEELVVRAASVDGYLTSKPKAKTIQPGGETSSILLVVMWLVAHRFRQPSPTGACLRL
jgi:hypothetical protein